MNAVGQEFLFGLAGIAATLLGTFLVAVFFYLDSEMHRRLVASEAADLYLRSGIRWVFTAYSIPLFAPLALAALDPVWGAAVFIALSGVLVMMTIDTGRRILVKGAAGDSWALAINEWLTSIAVLAAVALPWFLGGWPPSPSAYAPSLLLILGSGFTSTVSLAMAQFDATMGMAPAQADLSTEKGTAS